MKTLLTLLAMLFAVNFAYAQNTLWPGTSENSNVGIGTTAPYWYFHGGNNKVLEISNPNTVLNSQSHVILSSGSVLDGSFGGTISWVSKNSTGWKGMAYIGSILQGSAATNASASLVFATGNNATITQRMIIDKNGNVGIGTTDPNSPLHIYAGSGNSIVTALRLQGGEGSTSSGLSLLFSSSYTATDYQTGRISAITSGWGTDFKSDLTFYSNTGISGNSLTEKMRITSNGNVGIGTTSPDQKLTVNGSIHSSEVKVDTSISVPDYVFDADYKLASLTEVKEYIAKNHHLPEMPSAAQISKDGLKLGEMNILLLKKVEELTLHLIEKDGKEKEQEKRLSAQQEQITQLNQKVELLLKKPSNLK